MSETDKIQYLIVDTSAFIKNAPLQDIGNNVITEQDVVDEITSKRQLRRLVVLPYDLKVTTAFPENIKFVSEFAKKTGDYPSLSSTDIKVIALTYQLEKEKVGTDHLKEAPAIARTITGYEAQPEDHTKPLVGFYMPSDDEFSQDNESGSLQNDKEISNEDCVVIRETRQNAKIGAGKEEEEEVEEDLHFDGSCNQSESDYETAESDIESNRTDDLAKRFEKLMCEPTDFEIEGQDGKKLDINHILAPVSSRDFIDQDDSESEDRENDDNDDDDNGWITPRNIKNVKKNMDADVIKEKPAIVACLTMDFAMQNVLMQIGLNVATLDGKVIKQMRTFILRCYACFKTTSVMTKVFCPNCGYKTLKKVAISVNDDGKQQIHINFRKPLSAKGKKFSLPTPQGGKHANNPILCEDQPVPDQRPSRLARTKNDPLHDDYIAGYSPFIMRDVNSKSAMLGIRPSGTVKYWMRKNPNESKRRRK